MDKYIVENEPWALGEKQDEDSRARLATVLYTSAEALRIVTALAHPVIPESTAQIWTQLGLGDIRKFDLDEFEVGTASPGNEARRSASRCSRVPTRAPLKGCRQMEEQGRPATTAVADSKPEADNAACCGNAGSRSDSSGEYT